jgi:hypothetical protein
MSVVSLRSFALLVADLFVLYGIFPSSENDDGSQFCGHQRRKAIVVLAFFIA